MIIRNTLVNKVCVKLDPENSKIRTKSGVELYVDTTIEKEKHVTRTGEVIAVPKSLHKKLTDSMPWETDIELQVGDKVVMHYLAVINCIAKTKKHMIREGNDLYIFIDYKNIFMVERDGNIIPVNGYVLVEPEEDPAWIEKIERFKKINIEIPDLRKSSNKNVVFGRIVYIGSKNRRYQEEYKSDEGYNFEVGDVVIMKRIRNVPMEYAYHTRTDNGKTLYRVQRHDILAKF